MEKAKVYFTDMRVRPEGQNLQQKLAALIKRAGIDSIDFHDRFAAIKIHFGEAGNLSFLRPNFARTVADEIKKRGGRPFLTDCNTLYVGSRKHALEHIETAYLNGFPPTRPAVTSSSVTASRGPTMLPCRCRTGNWCTKRRSGAPSWTPISSFRSTTSRGMK